VTNKKLPGILTKVIHPFIANIPQSILDDLKSRIRNTRWPDEITGSGWTYGASLSYTKELTNHWLNEFDWREIENEINSYPNYIADINGYKIHFIHIKGIGKKSVPLVISHGWPGSFLEMMKLIPLLTTDPEFSFDLVIPSLPGFGFSGRINKPGCNLWFMASLWHRLMKELGYGKFGAQGGDFGAGVSTALALKFPQDLTGLHLNYIPGSYLPYLNEKESLTNEEIQFRKSADDWFQREGAYAHQHRTKPLSLAYGLNDSPVGLCAWLLEKFCSWSDCKGNVENVFTKNELLANTTLYWVTGTIHSSIRLYNENIEAPLHFSKEDFVSAPVGIARFPREEPFPPRSYIERGYQVRHWSEMPAGGHFAAMEQPRLLADDIIKFFKTIS
jgi:pimeloyl-ACP methyl ester carboxylesterase